MYVKQTPAIVDDERRRANTDYFMYVSRVRVMCFVPNHGTFPALTNE